MFVRRSSVTFSYLFSTKNIGMDPVMDKNFETILRLQMTESCLDDGDIEVQLEEIKRKFDQGGMANVLKYVEDMREMWKKIPVNIGVVGRAGVGKSTFINAYRNIEYDDDEGAAPVGVTQTTMEACAYPDPKHENITVWDVPGVGTKEFPRQSYLTNEKVGIDRYDFVIILSSSRFTEDEIWLREEMARLQKPAFLVRSKVMQDVNNERRRKKSNLGKSEKEVLDETIAKYKEEMKVDSKVYFIDSLEKEHPHLHFEDLLVDIVKEAPAAKQEAILLNLEGQFSKLIDEKVKILKQRRWLVALGSIGAKLIGMGFSEELRENLDYKLISEEIELYRKQLGLEEERLAQLPEGAQTRGIIVEILSKWKQNVSDMMNSMAKNNSFLDLIIPLPSLFVGVVKNMKTTYQYCVYTLGEVADKMGEDAHKLKDTVLREGQDSE